MDSNKPKSDTKRKQTWFLSNFVFESESSPKRPRTDTNEKINDQSDIDSIETNTRNCSISAQNIQSENWIDKYPPRDVSELAINSKKIEEVELWLYRALHDASYCNQMLLLSGPAGCGKTAVLRVLAKKFGVTISEWVNPVDIEYVKDLGPNSYTFQERQIDKFTEFLLKASRFRSLLSTNDSPRIVLVEDFPNILIKDPSEFLNVLQKYRDRGKSPMVFICTDSRDGGLNTLWHLFPPNVLDKFLIDQICFNPVSTTGMKQALKRIASLVGNDSTYFKIPNPGCIDSIIYSSMGDIRSAVNNLFFASLKGNVGATLKSVKTKEVKGKDKKKKEKLQTKLVSIGKDETISVMHGVGRVLNPKLTEKLTAKDHQQFTHSPQSIVEAFQVQPASFVGYLHENYLPHFSDIDYVMNATNALSDADCFMNEWREKDGKIYGLTVAIAGLMIANKAPVSSWHPIKGAKKSTVTYPLISELPPLDRNQMVCGKVLATDFKSYCKIIYDGKSNDESCLIEEEYTIEE